MSERSERPADAARPLLARVSVAILLCAAVLALVALLPAAHGRARRAGELLPSTLSLTYLRISLRERPDDAELRWTLAQRAMAAGLFEEALQVLAPLLAFDAQQGHRARLLRVEIRYRTWSAIPADAAAARAAARARLVREIVPFADLDLAEAEAGHLAALCAQCEQQALRARLLDRLARRHGPTHLPSIEAAERAHLEAGQTWEAAQLHLWAAHATYGAVAQGHALRALSLARSTGRPHEVWQLFLRLREQLGDAEPLLELGLLLALDLEDDALVFELAEALLDKHPDDAERHASVAQIATWTGKSLRALDEYVWLARNSTLPEARERALVLAHAQADLRLVASLGEAGVPHTAHALLERAALYEALAEPERALDLIAAGLGGALANDPTIWDLRLALQLRTGQLADALRTLEEMDARFAATPARAQQRAELLALLGRAEEAPDALLRGMAEPSEPQLRTLASLAWASDDVARASAAYAALVSSPNSQEDDFHRLAQLQRELGKERAVLATASAGFERFLSPSLFWLAVSAALSTGDYAELFSLLERAERSESLMRGSAYWRLRVSHRQGRVAQALNERKWAQAEQLLSAAETELERARQLAHLDRTDGTAYASLARAQRAQKLALALGLDDRTKLARAYAEQAADLSERERVHVLHRLGEDEQAVHGALVALRSTALSAREQKTLAEDAEALAQPLPRRAFVHGDITEMRDLRLAQTRAGGEYNWPGGGILGAVSYVVMDPSRDARFALARTHQLAAWLRGTARARRHDSSITFGVDTRDGGSARPFGMFTQELRIGVNAQLWTGASVNEVASDTAALRALGVRDELSFGSTVRFGSYYYVDARATGHVYSSRDRSYLGAGVTGDVATGVDLFRPGGPRRGNLRLASRFAPRFAASDVPDEIRTPERSPSGWLVPQSSTWLGLGATLLRGQLTHAPVSGRSFSYLLDASAGWLWPNQALGFFARAGIGTSVLGRDQLCLSGRASNVAGTAPGSAAWSIETDYVLSLWR